MHFGFAKVEIAELENESLAPTNLDVIESAREACLSIAALSKYVIIPNDTSKGSTTVIPCRWFFRFMCTVFYLSTEEFEAIVAELDEICV